MPENVSDPRPQPPLEWLQEYSQLLAASINRAFSAGSQALDADVAEAKRRLQAVDDWIKATPAARRCKCGRYAWEDDTVEIIGSDGSMHFNDCCHPSGSKK